MKSILVFKALSRGGEVEFGGEKVGEEEESVTNEKRGMSMRV